MNSGLGSVIKSYKNLFFVLSILLIVFMLFSMYLTNSYNQNAFEVYLNGKLMRFFYTEKYNNGFLTLSNHAGNIYGNDIFNYQPNTIDFKDKIELIINEYEVYNSSGIRRPYNKIYGDNWTYKKIDNTNIKLEIKRMNKIIYNGGFISDLSPYIYEKGRYYIHIYSTRNDNLFTSVKTHISFNVIVGGGNRE